MTIRQIQMNTPVLVSQPVKIFIGRNSPFSVVVLNPVAYQPYSAAQMEAITRVVLKYTPVAGANAEYIDSDVAENEGMFDWETSASFGRVMIDPGTAPFSPGTDNAAEVIVFDATYPSGRVVAQVRMIVSDEAADDAVLVGVIGTTAALDVTTDYNMVTADLSRRSICLLAATDKNIYLPAGTEAMNGKRVTFIQGSTGRVIANAADGDTLVSTGETQLISGSLFAAVTLEYKYAVRTWIGISALGKWGTPT
jgi:hypothetical protein